MTGRGGRSRDALGGFRSANYDRVAAELTVARAAEADLEIERRRVPVPSWPLKGNDDPWREVYIAILGTWPDALDLGMLKCSFLREDLRFEEVVPVERVTAKGSLEDLAITGRARSDHETPCPCSAKSLR